jgi:hypothetical protein
VKDFRENKKIAWRGNEQSAESIETDFVEYFAEYFLYRKSADSSDDK